MLPQQRRVEIGGRCVDDRGGLIRRRELSHLLLPLADNGRIAVLATVMRQDIARLLIDEVVDVVADGIPDHCLLVGARGGTHIRLQHLHELADIGGRLRVGLVEVLLLQIIVHDLFEALLHRVGCGELLPLLPHEIGAHEARHTEETDELLRFGFAFIARVRRHQRLEFVRRKLLALADNGSVVQIKIIVVDLRIEVVVRIRIDQHDEGERILLRQDRLGALMRHHVPDAQALREGRCGQVALGHQVLHPLRAVLVDRKPSQIAVQLPPVGQHIHGLEEMRGDLCIRVVQRLSGQHLGRYLQLRMVREDGCISLAQLIGREFGEVRQVEFAVDGQLMLRLGRAQIALCIRHLVLADLGWQSFNPIHTRLRIREILIRKPQWRIPYRHRS